MAGSVKPGRCLIARSPNVNASGANEQASTVTVRSGNMRPDEILFEFRAVGRMIRVSAIDPATGTEVVVVGPAGAGDAGLKHVAERKLVYVLENRCSNVAN